MKRHSLLDGDASTLSMPPAAPAANVFSDEHEVDDDDDFGFDMVADGFRPDNDRISGRPLSVATEREMQGGLIEEEGRDEEAEREEGGAQQVRQKDQQQVPIRTVSAHYSSRPVTPSAPSRNSIRKSQPYAAAQPNPFFSPDDNDDDDDEPAEQPHGLQFEPDHYDDMRRSMSTTSSRMYARTNSPRFGAGPSHPYALYQQGTMPRSPSNATASTIRPLDRRSSSLRHGPQHPYTMYPQGVGEDLDDFNDEDEDDEESALRQNPVTIGFPGLGQNFTRRVGPDGEEQDIIGEDGHTEQLPPYSRYPDEGPEKMPLLLPTALHSRAPVAGSDPTMPLMHTILQPSATRQSMTDASQRSERHASMASLERLRSRSDNVSLQPKSKEWKDATWKQKARIKFCGIPFWCYVLALGVISFIATILGSVIGGFVAGRSHHPPPSTPTVTLTTSLLDASIIASPTSMAPSQGTFALSLSPPQQTQAACLVEPDQQQAWDCNIVPNAQIAISVGTGSSSGDGSQTGASIFYAADIEIAYGAQSSYMNTSFSTFLTVTDTDDVDAGPAFYFTALYDKVVVVPEDAFDPAAQQLKRDAKPEPHYPYPGWYAPNQWAQQKQVAKPSERPWFCVWNGTLLEGFIYVDRNSNWTGTPTGSHASATPTSAPYPTSPAAMNTTIPPSTMPYMSTTTAGQYAQSTYPTDTPYPSSTPSTDPYNNSNDDDDDDDYSQNYRKPYKRQDDGPNGPILWENLPVYPYLIKLEERRLPSNDQPPYCQQFQILDNGEANWVGTGPNNATPITFNLKEQDPSFGAYESAGIGDVSRRLRARGSGSGSGDIGCHCQWTSGGNMPGTSN